MKSNNWDFDSNHYMAEWYFCSKRGSKGNINKLIRSTIEILIDEGIKSNLLSLDERDYLISSLYLDVIKKTHIEIISSANGSSDLLHVLVSIFDENGEIEELRISKDTVQNELKRINHFNAEKEYIPYPFDITLGITGKDEIYFDIHLNWDIWFEYVLCRPKWYAKYDANDMIGPDEEIDYRKHAFSNVELAKINGTKLNEYLKKLKANVFIQKEFNLEFHHTDNWSGYHGMTNEEGVELLN